MADVRLDFYDLDDEALPDVCMKCGAASTLRPVKTFSWMPYWARFMPYGSGYAFIKRRLVPVPLCDRHKNHWMMRYLVIFGGLGLALLLFVGGILIGLGSDDSGSALLKGLAIGMMASGFLLLLVWIVTTIVLNATMIVVSEITDDTITLRHVSPEFVRAYREMARGGIDSERTARKPFRRPGGRRPRDDDEPPDDQYRRR